MRKFRFDPRALREFEEGVDYYLGRSPEAASRFVDEFEAAVDFVLQNPVAPARVEGETRRWNLHRFPYALIYRPVEDGILIVAVMYAGREPDYWKGRRR